MPYITVNMLPRMYQMTFDDIFAGITEDMLEPIKDTHDTRTRYVKTVNPKLVERTDIDGMCNAIRNFNFKYASLIRTEDKSKLYRSFKIPKRSGGLRQIDAPLDDLTDCLRELKWLLENRLYANYHTAAFAYVRGRSTIDSVKRHQKNQSRWFLKLDFSKFFPSTTPEFMTKMIYDLFPFCEIVKEWGMKEELDKMFSVCFLNGGLPQGTPTSPLLTNMMMIPIDHYIAAYCHKHSPTLVYTRYADDILISSQISFHWTDVQNDLINIINKFGAPFQLNKEKTRYGSSAGRNWNLGVMLNKDNEITIGHEKKKVFKAMCFSFGNDITQGVRWKLEDVQHFLGLYSYYSMVEKDSINKIVNDYSAKFGLNIIDKAKELLKS